MLDLSPQTANGKTNFVVLIICVVCHSSITMTTIVDQPLEVAIIGGGPAGLVSLKTLLEHGVEHVALFEETDRVGGLWNTAASSSARPNIPPHASPLKATIATSSQPVYEEFLSTNLPKDLCSFWGYPYPSQAEFFPNAGAVLQYYQGYCQNFHLSNHIHLNTRVVMCFKGEHDDNLWKIETIDTILTSNVESQEDYTASTRRRIWKSKRLLVCNGHFRKAFVPHDIPGLQYFRGPMLHSSAFQSPKHYQHKTVLIVGGAISASDIARHLVGYSKRILISTRSWGIPQRMLFRRLQKERSVTIVPRIDHISSGGKIVFESSPRDTTHPGYAKPDSLTIPQPDVILFATGYRYHFEFLPDGGTANLSGSDGYKLKDLYKRIVSIHDPTSLAFIGITNANFSPAIVMEYQALWYTRCVVLTENGESVVERIQHQYDSHREEYPKQDVLFTKFPSYCNSLASDLVGTRGYWMQLLCYRLPLHVKSLWDRRHPYLVACFIAVLSGTIHRLLMKGSEIA
jgi:thioredoxin reductase